MDVNFILLCGRVVAPPEVVTRDGRRSRRLLVAARTAQPRRIDVLRVVEEPVDEEPPPLDVGDRVLVVGRIIRRFHDNPDVHSSRHEIAADVLARVGDTVPSR